MASRKPRRCSCRRRAALARAPYQALLGLQAWRAHSRLVQHTYLRRDPRTAAVQEQRQQSWRRPSWAAAEQCCCSSFKCWKCSEICVNAGVRLGRLLTKLVGQPSHGSTSCLWSILPPSAALAPAQIAMVDVGAIIKPKAFHRKLTQYSFENRLDMSWWRIQAVAFLPLPLILVAVLSTPAPRRVRDRVLWFTEQVRNRAADRVVARCCG